MPLEAARKNFESGCFEILICKRMEKKQWLTKMDINNGKNRKNTRN